MSTHTKSRRSTVSTYKKSINSEIKPLISTVIEESKRLEILNRQINRSTCENIVKQISDYRKSLSPGLKKLDKADSNLVNMYEHLLKKPLNDLKTSSLSSEINIRPSSKRTDQKPKKFDPSMFAEIDFKDTVWPEESIIDSQLFDILNSQEFKRPIFNSWIDQRPKIRNVRIKSRIGEINKKFFKIEKKRSVESVRRSTPRVLTPWTYTGKGYSCLTSPYI